MQFARLGVCLGVLALTTTLMPAKSSGSGASSEIRLANGVYRPAATNAAPAWYQADRVERSPLGHRYLALTVSAPLDDMDRHRLTSQGFEIVDFIPPDTYRVRALPHAGTQVADLARLTWMGEIPSHYKVATQLAATTAGKSPSTALPIRVVLEEGEPPGRVIGLLQGMDHDARPVGHEGSWRVVAEIPAPSFSGTLSRLAALPEVAAIEPARPLRLFNQDAVWVHQSFVGPSPQQTPIFDRGIFGCGQIVGVADSGQDYDLCYFHDGTDPPVSSCVTTPCPAAAPDMSRRKDILYYNWSGTPTGDDDTCPALLGGSGHGSHTSGTVAGDRMPYADCAAHTSAARDGGDGQAPGAHLVIQEMGDGLEYLNNLQGSVWNLSDVAYTSGARIHSNSWGGACHDLLGQCIVGCTMPYDSFARDADLAMWTYPDFLLVYSSGNAGDFCPAPQAVGTPAIAKSPITVGALGHGSAATTVPSFSSPGPVFDGRLKPTVAAQGQSTVSAASDAVPSTFNCGTCSLDGTSMAAPTVAGLAALIREYYEEGFYATGVRNGAQGFSPSGALVKATLVDGAVALGPNAPAPDFLAGYGRIQLDRTLAFAGSPFSLFVDDHREGLVTDGIVTHAFDVSGSSPFRATLAWSDYPAALLAAAARVNELRLEVVDPAGAVWFQTIDPSTGAPVQTSDPTDLHDGINVLERLVFDDPQPGRWIVRVRGVSVPWGPQPFALVVRGDMGPCAAPPAPASPSLAAPADGQVQVSWNAVAGAQGYNIYRSLGECPGASWVPVALGLTETSVLDQGVSGGAYYAYRVTAASDAAAACESAPSPCASIVPTGECLLAPTFAGVASVASLGNATCGVRLDWSAATPLCAGEVRYNVYRSSDPGFDPAPSHLVAACVAGSTYSDSIDLQHGATYHYVVRSEDATTGHGGPCWGGNEDSNTVLASVSPTGPPEPGTWTDDAGDTGQAKLLPTPPWGVAPSGGNAGPAAYAVTSGAGICADTTTPAIHLPDPGAGPQLTFTTKHDLEYDPDGIIFGREGSLGQVEIAEGPGFANWTRVPLTPDYPAPMEFPYNLCPTTQTAGNFFSGIDLTYQTYSASLANWAGGEVKIRFHLSGDLLFPGGGWWIDDVAVTAAMIPGACATASSGPPPIPDGASVPGEPLRVAKSGSSLALTWDATQCAIAAVNVYRGSIGDYSAFTGGECALPGNGSAILDMPDDVWFLVTATDGVDTDGSWSRDAQGNELSYGGASAVCPEITQHAPGPPCP